MQGLKVNGKAWNSTALPHAGRPRRHPRVRHGLQAVVLGTGKNAAPTSLTKDDKVPTPRERRDHRLRPAVDNTSATTAAFAPVDCRDRGRAAVQYTLTSADRAKAPAGWTLQGSADGKRWRDLDRRSGETFSWDRQTRVFAASARDLPRTTGW